MKEKPLASLRRNQNYFRKKSFVCKITSKGNFTPSGIESELSQHLMSSLRKSRYHFRKWVNVHRAVLKRKKHSEYFIPPKVTFKFSSFHVKLDLVVLARSKTTFENKSAIIGLRRKQKILTKSVIRFQIRMERVLLHLGNQLTKFNKVRRSQNHSWKQLNIRRAIPKTKIHSVKLVLFMTLSFCVKITSNTIHYILWIQFIFWLQLCLTSNTKRENK